MNIDVDFLEKLGANKGHSYEKLLGVLMDAFHQASRGKGKERHCTGERFEEQPICEISRRLGLGFSLGQAVKKIYEQDRFEEKERRVTELLGAMVYIASAIILLEEE